MESHAAGQQKWDFDFQGLSMVLQFFAYPILQLAAQEGVAMVNEVNRKKAVAQQAAYGKKAEAAPVSLFDQAFTAVTSAAKGPSNYDLLSILSDGPAVNF